MSAQCIKNKIRFFVVTLWSPLFVVMLARGKKNTGAILFFFLLFLYDAPCFFFEHKEKKHNIQKKHKEKKA
jgi:hypothetical protein